MDYLKVIRNGLKLWQMLTLEPWFEKYQTIALSIYK